MAPDHRWRSAASCASASSWAVRRSSRASRSRARDSNLFRLCRFLRSGRPFPGALSVLNPGRLGVEVVDLLDKPLAHSDFRLPNQRQHLLTHLLQVLRLGVGHRPRGRQLFDAGGQPFAVQR